MTSDLFDFLLSVLSCRLALLPDKPEETHPGTLRALWHAAAGCPMVIERAHDLDLPVLDGEAGFRLIDSLMRRIAGVPLAHLTGRQCFMGLEFLVGPGALIPRKETEIVAAAVLSIVGEIAAGTDEVVVADVCTGAGNLALSVAHDQPRARVFGADLSPDAIDLARRNAAHLGLEGQVDWGVGDLLDPVRERGLAGKLDVLICNPPYISSGKVQGMVPEISDHEPRMAFDGGPFGVSLLSRLLTEGPEFLRPGGWLCFEVGRGQGKSMAQKAERTGAFSEIKTCEDRLGEIRAVLARK